MTELLPKISVITVSFNQAQFIRDCIESVKNQSYPNFEHIIIDGGSTDGTIEILKEYTHLNWVSEPDNGQTHALNKGFKKATGQIIGWLNSDDYYTAGALHIVAKELANYPVLLGGGNIVDRFGKQTGYVPNIERNWFDILKNWIYHSSFLQPAVFFSKEVLDSVKLSDGNYLDEDLHYVMDYDLWLRIALKFPFSRRVAKALSCFRVYDESKTGTAKLSTDHEIRRVYQKYSSLISRQECSTSFVISFVKFDDNLFRTVDSINSQSFSDLEIILCPLDKSIDIQHVVIKLRQNFTRLVIRSTAEVNTDIHLATRDAILLSRGAVCMLLEAGNLIDHDFNINLIQYFASQSLGAIIPSIGNESVLDSFCVQTNGVNMFNAQSLLIEPYTPTNIAFRKIALLELVEFFNSDDSLHYVRAELFRLLYKGWGINVNNILKVNNNGVSSLPAKEELTQRLPTTIAKMISDNYDERQVDPFSVVRIEHGFSLVIADDYVQACRKFLE